MSAKSKPSRSAVLVLGMHRSGTSALAGTLSILGCDLPATPMKANENNPKGYFESSKFHALHDRLLESAGSSWDDWLPVNPGWFESARAEEYRDRIAAALRDEFGASRLFVMKDPRICRILPFWLDVLKREDCAPLIVHTHRHPLEVARSLERRDGIGLDLGMLLWMRHILDAERDSRGTRRCFTSYERLMDNWSDVAQGVQDRLDIKLPRMTRNVAGEIEEFLSPDLKHFSDTPAKVLRSPMISEWVRDLYRIVESWAESGENEDDLETLDRIREEFDTAAPAFHRLVEVGQQTSRTLQEKIGEIARLSETASELQAKLGEADTTVNELRQQLSDARAEAQTQEAKTAELQQEIERRGALADDLTAKLDRAAAERNAERELAQRLEAELERSREELAALQHEFAQTRSHLEQRTHEAEETAKQLAEAQADVAERTSQIETLRAEIGRQERDLAARNETARQHASDMANISTLLSERESSLNASRAEIAELKGSVKSLTDQLDEERLSHAAAVARESEQVRELEQSVESQVRELTQIAQILLDTETKLEQAQAKSSHESEKARKLQAERDALRDASKRAEKETAELQDKLKTMTEKSKRAEARVADLENSHSWRITAPLRSLSRALTGRGRR